MTRTEQQKTRWGTAGYDVREVDEGQMLKGFKCCSKKLGLYPEGGGESWSF